MLSSPPGVASIRRTKSASLLSKGKSQKGERKENKDKLCCTLLTLYFNGAGRWGGESITSVSLVQLFLKGFSCIAQFR